MFLDIWDWFKAVFKWWIKTIGGGLVALFQIFYTIKYREAPPVISWVILGTCLCFAVFLAWRDEHHKIYAESIDKIVRKIIDLISDPSHQSLIERHDLIGALIYYADALKTEQHTKKVCDRIEELGHGDAFEFLGLVYEPKTFENKKWKLVREASLSGKDVRLDINVLDFIRPQWAKNNGLKKIPLTEEGQAEREIRSEAYKTRVEETSAARYFRKKSKRL